MADTVDLTRAEIAKLAGGNPRVIRALELLLAASNTVVTTDLSATTSRLSDVQLAAELAVALAQQALAELQRVREAQASVVAAQVEDLSPPAATTDDVAQLRALLEEFAARPLPAAPEDLAGLRDLVEGLALMPLTPDLSGAVQAAREALDRIDLAPVRELAQALQLAPPLATLAELAQVRQQVEALQLAPPVDPSSGSLSNTGVSAGTYGDAVTYGYPVITVDAQGRITAASTASSAELPGSLLQVTSVGYDKLDVLSGNTILGNATGSVANPAAISCTAAGRALLDDASASDQLTTLGVSAFAKTILDDADAATVRATIGAAAAAGATITVNESDGTPSAADISQIQFSSSHFLLTDDTPASGAMQVELKDGGVPLAKMADLAQDKFIIRTSASTGVPETATCTAAGRALLDDANAAAQLTTLGVSAFAQTILDDANAAAARTTLGAASSTARTARGMAVGARILRTSSDVIQYTADSLVVDDSGGTDPVVLSAVNVSPSKATSGPAANGRDQAGAFSNNVWTYLHVVYNPSGPTVAGLWSLSSTSPTLPSGFTHSALVHAAYTFTSGYIEQAGANGDVIFANPVSDVVLLSNGGATTSTAVSTSSAVPPITRLGKFFVNFQSTGTTPSSTAIHTSNAAASGALFTVSPAAAQATQLWFEMATDGSNQIFYKNGLSGAKCNIYGYGFRL